MFFVTKTYKFKKSDVSKLKHKSDPFHLVNIYR